MKRFEFQIEKRFHRWRLDEYLFDRFREYSKTYLRSVLKDELCELNGEPTNGGRIVRHNDFVEIEIDTDRARAMKPQKAELDIVFEDRDLIVINKPSGVLVHPTHRERDGTLLNGVTYYLNSERRSESSFIRPLPVHRIDRDTSGIVVFGLNQRASRIITKQLRDRKTDKKYLALVSGSRPKIKATIKKPITRDADRKLHIVSIDGAEAVTNYRIVEDRGSRHLLEVVPVTGRTNQIRVHFLSEGFPIVGDKLYGGEEYSRLCLHAASLRLRHPATNDWLVLEAGAPNF